MRPIRVLPDPMSMVLRHVDVSGTSLMPLRHSFVFWEISLRTLLHQYVAAATTPKAGFHANRCPHAKSDGTLHLDARRGGFVGAIDWATKRQH